MEETMMAETEEEIGLGLVQAREEPSPVRVRAHARG